MGESAESELVVLVFNEREAMDVMEEDGVWVL